MEVQTWLSGNENRLLEPTRNKLRLAEEDLLRLTHVNERFLERLLCLRWPEQTPRPPSLGVLACAMATRGWLRQLRIHNAYYRSIATTEGYLATLAQGPRARPSGSRAVRRRTCDDGSVRE